MITKWLKDSGLIVNESKTEVCLFHNDDQPLVQLNILGVRVTSTKSINVLGVEFDSKLNWNTHVSKAISKARKSLFALRLLKKHFKNNEMRTLLDSHFYSVLYYNANIWLTPNLSSDSKQNLLSISANALRSCLMHDGFNISFENLHLSHKKCTPLQHSHYQLALTLYDKLNFNEPEPCHETVTILDQIICTRRQSKFQIYRNNFLKIGLNTTSNKLSHLSNLISLEHLNLSKPQFKKIAKLLFLKYGKT